MSVPALQSVRGWCPGALRPMESGDGLIVRLRPRCGALSVAVVSEIAALAESHGNGHIDLTRRANVQLRGVSEERLSSLWQRLSELGLLDASADAEAVRNVMVSPLSGIDPSDVADVRPLAVALETALGAERDLWRLPAKFGFAVDGGGMLPLDGIRADVWLKAARNDDVMGILVGVDRPEGIDWLGSTTLDAAAAVAVRIARAFLDSRPDARARMRDLSQSAHDAVRLAVAPHLDGMVSASHVHFPERFLGQISCDDRPVAVGMAAPFGRVEASALAALASAARDLGALEFRLSPWRAFYAPAQDANDAAELSLAAAANGFIVDAGDPLLAIEACPGAPGCRSAALDTRAAARHLAPMVARLGARSCHVSGCAKGCACSQAADLVLVGTAERFGVLRSATAQDEPRLFVSPDRLSDLPQLLKTV
jgi:precorrin-3B synthase